MKSTSGGATLGAGAGQPLAVMAAVQVLRAVAQNKQGLEHAILGEIIEAWIDTAELNQKPLSSRLTVSRIHERV
jgi:predicted XRE-type DNA-binding protein